ncbi:MAG: hypothetical protein A2086_10790 [Spirochaetes bacterium GWD1_27_9]|nr:MAG: hypothetical protein A2Z98_18340 [Spirochaetes bacterium GWB1_27_13]OHD28277.1 MAG: hypothetical protein A2Y34_09675 [Spirochaetes bacterium GWC1_27_15]OHD35044.1 MAG: hypothetical protein A2086_10790 [Spirochaetes bacterium GWD1_27_9]
MQKSQINIGLLHSLSGPMAISGKMLISTMMMAIEEINQNGGILGKMINPIIEDGESNHNVFAQKAEKLITENNVVSIFGCWTSSARKSVKNIVEKYNSLLWYPTQYEGFEQSPNIIYTGSCLNQQVIPAVKWAISENLCDKCLLVGSDYVFPRTANTLIKTLITQSGGHIIAEKYVSLDSVDFKEVIDILTTEKVDIVFNTINGESNVAFFKRCAGAHLKPEITPIMSFSLSEIELSIIKKYGAGHYACWNYFQGINSKTNKDFINKYYNKFDKSTPISAPVIDAYSQLYLWEKIVKTCQSFNPQDVLKNAAGTVYESPEGIIEILPNNHIRHRAFIGKAAKDGLFQIIKETPVIDPEPWLGIENSREPYKELILEALRNYPDVLHINCSLQDEIEKKKHLEAILELKNIHLLQLTQAVEQSPASIVITDLDGNITYVNPKFISLTGYNFLELKGKNPRILKTEHTPSSVYKNMWHIISSGGIWTGEFLNKKKNGELYWERAAISSIKNTEGKIINYIAVKEDITQQKLIEIALQTSNHKLEENIKEIEKLKNQLYEQAIRDPLTKLYNRRYLEERIDLDFQTAARTKINLSIAMLDIDHFKSINDTFGHDAGDIVLTNLSKFLSNSIRKTDFIYRYGGEEFLLVFIDCDVKSAKILSEKIRMNFSEYISEIDNHKIKVTLSIGISSYPQQGNDFHKIISNADEALYISKNSGRNTVTIWEEKEIK